MFHVMIYAALPMLVIIGLAFAVFGTPGAMVAGLIFLSAGLAAWAWESPRRGGAFFFLQAGFAYSFNLPIFAGISALIGVLALFGFFDRKPKMGEPAGPNP